MSVYILGAGAMGSLVAHELALGGKVAPTLILRTKTRLDAYIRDNSTLTVVRPVGSETATSRAKVAAVCSPPVGKEGKRVMIDNLVISTKTHSTVAALKPYVENINRDTNVLIVQNGMGMEATLKREIWPDPARQPRFFLAVSTHGAYKQNPTTIHHVGLGSLVMAEIPEGPDQETRSMFPPVLVDALLDRPVLNASYKPHSQFMLDQMEKLVVNACVNPLTAILDCYNGELFHGTNLVQSMKRIIKECVDCFRAEYPHLDDTPQANTYLDYDRLLTTVMDVCKITAQNSSSMREDVRRLNRTEIDWINGYVVGLGYKHRVATPVNKMMVSLVKSRLSIEQARESLALHKSIL